MASGYYWTVQIKLFRGKTFLLVLSIFYTENKAFLYSNKVLWIALLQSDRDVKGSDWGPPFKKLIIIACLWLKRVHRGKFNHRVSV